MTDFGAIRRVLWVTMGLNLVSTAVKLVVGALTGSLSLIASGFDSVFDAASNVIGLVGIRVAARPADADHPYGHRKAETIAALSIALLLFLTTWELIGSAVARLRDPSLIQAEVNVWSFAALLLGMSIHVGVAWYEMREGRRLGSEVLVADATHTRGDVMASLVVLVGLIAVRMGYPIADPIIALIVALFIAKIGIDIVRASSPTLMDAAVVPGDEIERIARSVPEVVSAHKARSRGHESDVFVDLHIRVDPDISTERSHAIAHQVQQQLRQARPDIRDVTVHVEPGAPAVWNGAAPAVHLRRLARRLGIDVHDVWAYEVDGKYHIECHLEVDGALSLQAAHALASSLEREALQAIPHLAQITTHIEPQGETLLPSRTELREDESARSVERAVYRSVDDPACHQVQVWRGNRGWVVSLHCHLPGEMALVEAHRVSTRIERRIRTEVSGLERVIVHTEPWQEAPPSTAERHGRAV